MGDDKKIDEGNEGFECHPQAAQEKQKGFKQTGKQDQEDCIEKADGADPCINGIFWLVMMRDGIMGADGKDQIDQNEEEIQGNPGYSGGIEEQDAQKDGCA